MLSTRKRNHPSFINNRVYDVSVLEFLVKCISERNDLFSPSILHRKRWKVFSAKGYSCVSCGLEGTKVVAWRDERSKGNDGEHLHVDLVAVCDDGYEVIITVDHRIPQTHPDSNNQMENLFPMCYDCNQAKGDKYEV